LTRLSYKVVGEIGSQLKSYDKELKRKTGHTLKQIAGHGKELLRIEKEKATTSVKPNLMAAVIPVSSGKGIIKGFTEAVRDIIRYLGFKSEVTSETDVAGLAQGVEMGADIVFLADDACFIAISLQQKYVIDNAKATAAGYIAALDYLTDGLQDKSVLIIGAGKVGNEGVKILKKMGVSVSIYDIDQARAFQVGQRQRIEVYKTIDQALNDCTVIFEASPAVDIIRAQHIKRETNIAACGIPIGITEEARYILGDRLIHDPLQIGVATMMMCCAGL